MPKKIPESKIRIYPKAEREILEIWKYTCEKWGKRKADEYVRGLHSFIENLQTDRQGWRRVPYRTLRGIYFKHYEHHYVFFREFKDGTFGIMSVLHENMDLPNRLLEDIQ